MFREMTSDHKRFIEKNCSKIQIETYLALFVLGALALFLLIFGIIIPFALLIALGLGAALGGYLIIKKSPGELKGSEFWIKQIEEKGDEIVWVKPFKTKHTLGLVITLFEENHFQIFTKEGYRIHFKCDNDKQKVLFFDLIKTYFKEAHLGFSHDIEALYKLDKERFIENLKKKSLYTPLSSFKNL